MAIPNIQENLNGPRGYLRLIFKSMNFQKCYEDLSSNYECLETSMMCFVQKHQLKSSLIGESLNPIHRSIDKVGQRLKIVF